MYMEQMLRASQRQRTTMSSVIGLDFCAQYSGEYQTIF